MTVVQTILHSSRLIDNDRTAHDVLIHALTEMGELALEVQIDQGKSYKRPGADGVVGEALDVIACMVDSIHVHAPHLSEEDLIQILEPKLNKWREKAAEIQASS